MVEYVDEWMNESVEEFCCCDVNKDGVIIVEEWMEISSCGWCG